MVILIALGAYQLAQGLPSLFGRPAPAWQTEETLDGTQESLDGLDLGDSQAPASVTVVPDDAAETPNSDAIPGSPQPRAAPRAGGQHRSAALTAVAFALAQRGKPYIWGGNGDPGFDCSGLTKAAYAAAKIALPRTAQDQYDYGPLLPAGAALRPGDLLFFGTPDNIHHVGISLGGTLMINAPTFGQTVRVQDYRNASDYAGSSRPAG